MYSISSTEYLAIGGILCLILMFLQTFRFYFKLGIVIIGTIIVTSVLPLPLFILRPKDYRNGLVPAFGYKVIANLLGFAFDVRGQENIDKNKGGVLIINHQSFFDVVAVTSIRPIVGRVAAVARKEVMYVFPFGPAAYLWGTIFIDRGNGKKARQQLSQESNEITMNSGKLIIFPEGTRHNGDKVLPFRKGAFYTAVQSQSMIQPVVVAKYDFYDPKRKYFGRSRNVISILPAIDCKGLTENDVPMLVDKAYLIMQRHFNELNAELGRKSDEKSN